MEYHRLVSNSAKRKVDIPKKNGKCADVTNTPSRYFRFLTASLSIPVGKAASPMLFNLVFHIALRARQTARIVEMGPAFPFIRDITHAGKN